MNEVINKFPISVIIKPHEDELFYSYLYRLAFANGCANIRSFIARVLLEEDDCHKAAHVNWNLDGWNLLPAIFQKIDLEDPVEFIMEHTLYPFQSVFLTENRQAMVVDALFNDIHAKNTQKVFPLISELYYCKQCKAEDIKAHGHHYIHRAHQLPGVTVCHKHHKPLYRVVDGKPVISPFTINEDKIKYAEFAAEILFATLQTNIKIIQQATMKQLGKSKNVSIPGLSVPIEKLLKNGFYSSKYLTVPDIIRVLMHVFGTIENLQKSLPEDYEATKRFVNSPDIEQYYVFIPFNTTILRMEHKECGTKFFTTPAGFVAGWKCPTCTKKPAVRKKQTKDSPDTDKQHKKSIPFEDRVKALVGDEYTVMGEYKGQNQPIAIQHNPCGHIQEFYPKHFLNGQRCERCTELIAAEKIPEIVNYMTDGQYTVTHVGTNLCEFREKGGATVEISLAKFLQEARRPTPSDILPVPIENLKEDWNDSIWKFYGGYQNKENLPVRIDKLALYREIRSWYKDDQLIFMEDLRTHFPESYYKTLKSGIKQLIKARLLFRIEPGIYTILIQKVTPLQLLREKYLVRNGNRIGIFDSKSLAYKMGLTDEKPDALYIMTNKESMEHGRRRIINGVPVHIRGNKLLIYEDNYKHIMVMEALKYCFHYDASRINRVLQFIKDNNLDLERFTGLMQFYSKNITNMFMKIWRQYNESDN